MAPPPPALPESFFAEPVLRVARRMIGCRLVRRTRGRLLIGRIVEAEAYAGHLDPASHSYRGPSQRCRTMFGPPGRLYVYFSYGNHYCANVTTSGDDLAAAVLLRAVEPVDGLDLMRAHRADRTPSATRAGALRAGSLDRELCNGPGKLAAAFAIDGRLDGLPLEHGGELWIAPGPGARRVLWTPRVGLGRNPAAGWVWRCVDAVSTAVTPIPTAWPCAPRPSPTLGQLRGRTGRLLPRQGAPRLGGRRAL